MQLRDRIVKSLSQARIPGLVNCFLSIRFAWTRARAIVVPGNGGTTTMPKHIGQWTGLAVTTIIVLGCDMDVLYAVPLGIMSGALATFFVALADRQMAARSGK
jgi:hypothetical protein